MGKCPITEDVGRALGLLAVGGCQPIHQRADVNDALAHVPERPTRDDLGRFRHEYGSWVATLVEVAMPERSCLDVGRWRVGGFRTRNATKSGTTK